MPIDFTDQEKAALIDLLVGVIEQNPFPQSQRIQLLRGVLAKVRPTPDLPNEDEEAVDDKPSIHE
ncbi:MAG TPA: hypothetical protein VFR68_09050 [Candidatus Dormibacteraeota bacterium]|nr:hypothetical protein [Candidatus Dormibacteraeota bacterium]